MADTYAKTPKGQEEIDHRSTGLSSRLRRLLIMIDGKRSNASLAQVVGEAELETTLKALELDGYIVPATQDPPPTVMPSLTVLEELNAMDLAGLPSDRSPQEFDMARNFMTNTLRTFNGPYAKLSLVQRIHASTGPQGLRGLFNEWLQAISETSLGRRRADELRTKLMSVI